MIDEEYGVTNCCGAEILWQQHKDGVYSQWEFCAICLEPFEMLTEEKYSKSKKDKELLDDIIRLRKE